VNFPKGVLPVAAAVSELSVYLTPASKSASQLIKGILYADSGGSRARCWAQRPS